MKKIIILLGLMISLSGCQGMSKDLIVNENLPNLVDAYQQGYNEALQFANIELDRLVSEGKVVLVNEEQDE